jgi:hypothetical protein
MSEPIDVNVINKQVENVISTSKQIAGELTYDDIDRMGGLSIFLERVKVNITDSINWTLSNQK